MRHEKYPGTQEKFEKFLIEHMGDENLSGPQIVAKLNEVISDYQIDEGVFGYINSNQINILSRAQENGIIYALGTRRGYKLVSSSVEEEINQDVTNSNDTLKVQDLSSAIDPSILALYEGNEKTSSNSSTSERSSHFILTMLLQEMFKARVFSFPTATIKGGLSRYRNFDMLMIRENRIKRFKDLQNADSSPVYKLTSIEIKRNILGDRVKLMDALFETSMNSQWANEALLVILDDVGMLDLGLQMFEYASSDVLQFATKNDIGILQIKQKKDEPYFEPQFIIKPVYRPQLNLEDFFSEKVHGPLISKINEIVGNFMSHEIKFYYEFDNDILALIRLLQDSIDNVMSQYKEPSKPEVIIGDPSVISKWIKMTWDPHPISQTTLLQMAETHENFAVKSVKDQIAPWIEHIFGS